MKTPLGQLSLKVCWSENLV